jgi:hypothetical protein
MPARTVSSAAPAAPGNNTLIIPSAMAATSLVLMASSTGQSGIARFRFKRLDNGDANLRGRQPAAGDGLRYSRCIFAALARSRL